MNKRTAKITQETADEIRRLKKEEGLTHREIAELYNISVSTVTSILSGGAWVQLKLPGIRK